MSNDFRILVTGSRDFRDTVLMQQKLAEHAYLLSPKDRTRVTVVHGGARGADTAADYAGNNLGMPVEIHVANWSAPCIPQCRPGHRRQRADGTDYCPSAGLYRNQLMVSLGADICLAFFVNGSKNNGTRDCARRARKTGIETVRIDCEMQTSNNNSKFWKEWRK